jgi:hypothetical protein
MLFDAAANIPSSGVALVEHVGAADGAASVMDVGGPSGIRDPSGIIDHPAVLPVQGGALPVGCELVAQGGTLPVRYFSTAHEVSVKSRSSNSSWLGNNGFMFGGSSSSRGGRGGSRGGSRGGRGGRGGRGAGRDRHFNLQSAQLRGAAAAAGTPPGRSRPSAVPQWGSCSITPGSPQVSSSCITHITVPDITVRAVYNADYNSQQQQQRLSLEWLRELGVEEVRAFFSGKSWLHGCLLPAGPAVVVRWWTGCRRVGGLGLWRGVVLARVCVCVCLCVCVCVCVCVRERE